MCYLGYPSNRAEIFYIYKVAQEHPRMAFNAFTDPATFGLLFQSQLWVLDGTQINGLHFGILKDFLFFRKHTK
jgi:hypothetical protein